MLLSIHPICLKQNQVVIRLASATVGTVAIALSLFMAPALADPFRNPGASQIDEQTEAAFEAMFVNGDYRSAADLLQSGNANEPMTYALRASIAYLNEDWDGLADNARLTLDAADRLITNDSQSLRGYLYRAVGHFMEGAHLLSTQSTVRATPTVLNKLRLVFDNLGRAEAIDSTDPELNLIKGYMDLMLAVNLPFSSPDQAIERLQAHGAPRYLVNRGIAIAYRDLGQEALAIEFVDQALAETPDNPELHYLKAQILRIQGETEESIRFFEMALERQQQLPLNVSEQIAYEFCRAENEMRERNRNCHRWADQQIEASTTDEEEDEQLYQFTQQTD
jgi:tetratricopeptide (TPR) repeat protein